MIITSATSTYSSPPQAAKDNANLASAQRTRDNSAEQKAAAELRRDAPAVNTEQTERVENDRDRDDALGQTVGRNLDVTA